MIGKDDGLGTQGQSKRQRRMSGASGPEMEVERFAPVPPVPAVPVVRSLPSDVVVDPGMTTGWTWTQGAKDDWTVDRQGLGEVCPTTGPGTGEPEDPDPGCVHWTRYEGLQVRSHGRETQGSEGP